MRQLIATFVVMALIGCSGASIPDKRRKDIAGVSDAGSKANANAAAQQTPLSTAPTLTNLSQQQNELGFLQSVNGKLCQRLQQLRTQCVASAGLIPETNELVLNCISGVAPGGNIQHTFQVEFQGPGGDFTLTVNEEQYNTNVFHGGDGLQTVTWSEKFTQLTKAPRLLEIYEMRLNGPDSQVLDVNAISRFDFKVNGQIVFDKSNLVPTTSGNPRSLSIDLARLLDLQKSSACSVPDQELAQLKEQAEAEASAAGNQGNVEISTLSKAQIQEQINVIIPQIQRERSRKMALETEVGVKVNGGCWASMPINKFEVLLDGVHLPDSAVEKTGSEKGNVGNALSYNFMFGETLKFSNASEGQVSLFRPGGRYVSNDFADWNIGSINFIKIVKGGTSYSSIERSKNCGIIGAVFGCGREWHNSETNITSLSNLTIKVNDQVLYKREVINHTFDRDHLEWQDMNLTRNPAYLGLMLRTDCQASN